MSTDDLPARLVAVARALGCAATHDDPVADLDLSALPHLLAAEPEVFRAPITAIAYLQAPTGWRQRVRLSVLMRVDHPLSRLVPLTDAERDLGVVVPAAASMPRLPTGSALTELVGHLSDLARSGAPLVLEKADWERWLDPDLTSTAAIGDLLAPGPAGRFAAYPIGRAVGSNRANGPGLLLPASRADLVGVVDPMTGEIIGGPDA